MLQVGKISRTLFILYLAVALLKGQNKLRKDIQQGCHALQLLSLLFQGPLEKLSFNLLQLFLAAVPNLGHPFFKQRIISITPALWQAAENRRLEGVKKLLPGEKRGLPYLLHSPQLRLQIPRIRLRPSGPFRQSKGFLQPSDNAFQLQAALPLQLLQPRGLLQGGSTFYPESSRFFPQPGGRPGMAPGEIVKPLHQKLQVPVTAVAAVDLRQAVKSASRLLFFIILLQDLLHNLLPQKLSFRFIQDTKGRIKVPQVVILPDHLQAEGMDSADVCTVQQQKLAAQVSKARVFPDGFLQGRSDALLHLRRRGVGKGYHKQPVYLQGVVPVCDQLQHPLHQHPGLPRTGTGCHQGIPPPAGNGLPLLLRPVAAGRFLRPLRALTVLHPHRLLPLPGFFPDSTRYAPLFRSLIRGSCFPPARCRTGRSPYRDSTGRHCFSPGGRA